MPCATTRSVLQFVGYNPQLVRYHRLLPVGLLCRCCRWPRLDQLRARQLRHCSAPRSPATCCWRPSSAAPVTSSVPILGAVLVTYLQNMLSDVTEVWQLYFGLMFIATVMYAPGGLAGLFMMHGPIWRAGASAGRAAAYALMLVPIALVAVGAVLLIEMINASRRQGGGRRDHEDRRASPSIPRAGCRGAFAVALLVGGGLLARLAWRRVAAAWERAQAMAREKGLIV